VVIRVKFTLSFEQELMNMPLYRMGEKYEWHMDPLLSAVIIIVVMVGTLFS
jgi:hypothetical protein